MNTSQCCSVKPALGPVAIVFLASLMVVPHVLLGVTPSEAALGFLKSRMGAAGILDGFVGINPAPGGGFLHRYRTTGAGAGGTLAAGHNAYLLQALNLFSWR